MKLLIHGALQTYKARHKKNGMTICKTRKKNMEKQISANYWILARRQKKCALSKLWLGNAFDLSILSGKDAFWETYYGSRKHELIHRSLLLFATVKSMFWRLSGSVTLHGDKMHYTYIYTYTHTHIWQMYTDSCTRHVNIIAPLILHLGTICRWVVNITPRPLDRQKIIPVPIEHETAWAHKSSKIISKQ